MVAIIATFTSFSTSMHLEILRGKGFKSRVKYYYSDILTPHLCLGDKFYSGSRSRATLSGINLATELELSICPTIVQN